MSDEIIPTNENENEVPEVERCVECGRILTDRMPKGWTEKGVCSGRCWGWLYGEYD